MPTHYEVEYLSYAGDSDCAEASDVTATLYQDYMAEKVPDDNSSNQAQYVDWINIYFSQTSTGEEFKLYLTDRGKAIRPAPTAVITDPPAGTAAASLVIMDERANDRWVLTFTPPATNSTTVFEFGVGTPGTKLKVKVKKQTGSFTCA